MTPATDSNVWIVIAAFNEAARLGATLADVCRLYSNVVVIDDGSRDRTHDIARKHPVWVLRHPINCGQGAALQTGIDFALGRGADVLVTFDADGQHAVEDVAKLVEVIQTDQADVALGSRFLGKSEGMPWSRWIVLKLAVLFTRVFSRVRVTDAHNGLRAFSKSSARRIRITQDRMAHASEILDQIRWHNLRMQEVPVTIRYTASTLDKGQSSWNALKIVGQLVLGRLIR